MIVIAAKFKLRPGKKDDFMNLAQSVIGPSRKEKGCVSYNLYSPVENPEAFMFFEEWADQDAFDAHLREPHFIEFADESKDMLEGDMDVNIYEAERKSLNE